jgi:predicted TIM-barrel fold metal-dependent hydrolase
MLLIGPRRNKHKSQIGGAVVLFENWITFCNENNIPIKIIDGNKFNYSNKIFALIIIAYNIFKNAHRCKVIILHGSNNDYLFFQIWFKIRSYLLNKHGKYFSAIFMRLK